MRIHFLQHVAFEGPAGIEDWARQRGHERSLTRLYRQETLPDHADYDWLIVMGGPMGVGDEQEFPWLTEEKTFIREAIDADKRVLGICLGAQLIASALGAGVFSNPHREIGWFEVQRAPQADATILAEVIPERISAFHWHGDTFELPDGAILLASSEACTNQGFIIDNRIVGLQFHLETTAASAARLIRNCGDELDSSLFVQSAEEILADPARFGNINKVMYALLSRLEAPG